ALNECDRAEEAAQVARGVAAKRTAKLGPDDPATLSAQHLFASALAKAGRAEEALAIYQGVAARRSARLGPDATATLEAKYELASTLLRLGRLAEAEQQYRDVLAAREKKEPEAWTTSLTRSRLGECLVGQKKYADAEPLLLQA